MPYLAAPALSLTFLENAWGGLAGHVSISGWLMILLLVRLVVALFTMTAAMLVSRAIGKKGKQSLDAGSTGRRYFAGVDTASGDTACIKER